MQWAGLDGGRGCAVTSTSGEQKMKILSSTALGGNRVMKPFDRRMEHMS